MVAATPIAVLFRPSGRRGKKLVATFLLESGATRTVHFGQRGAEDFTTHRNRARRRRYLARHAPREDWGDPLTAVDLGQRSLVTICNQISGRCP